MAKEVIADLVAQISMDGTKFSKGIGQVNRQLKTVQEELKTARSRFKQTGDAQDLLGSRSQTLTGKLKLQNSKVEMLAQAYEESRKNSDEFSKNTQNLATDLEKAKRELGETEHELKGVNQQLKNQPSKWTELGKSAETAGKKMQTAGRGLTDFGKTATTGVTVPILAAGVAVFKTASDFESAFTGTAKTFSGTTEQLADLREGIRDMAKEIPATTTEIAGVAEAAGQLGIQADSIESFTKTMIDMGEATNISSKDAATEFARFANIVGMSQDDFDRLGSSTVSLGNSMATTEKEISAMSLRLAAQGSLVGLSESQILALSASMSSLGIEAEAGGTAMSMVLKKIDGAVDKSGEKLEGFAKVAGVSSDKFADVWEKDAVGALDMFVKGLSDSGEEGENLTSILKDLGIKGIRESDTILRLAGSSDLLSKAVDTSSKAWEENTALTEEAEKRYATTESQLKIMWNRVKDLGITLGEVLIPAVMDAIDAAEPFIEKIEEGAQAFSEMNEEEQRSILKMIGFAAAIGPASIVLGGLTTTVGGALRVFGSLSTLLGTAKGAGLLARLGGLGVAGPVGLAIAGVVGLGLTIAALSKDQEKLQEVSLESANALTKQYESNGKLIDSLDKLRGKSLLTNDEFARYIDLQSELKEASDPGVIKAIKDEMAGLEEKSGFTNGELDTMVGLNNDITEALPGATKEITDQGEKIAGTTDELKKYNAELAKMATLEIEEEFYKAAENESILQQQKIDQQKTLNIFKIRERDIQKLLNGNSMEQLDTMGEQTKERLETLNAEQARYKAGTEQWQLLQDQIDPLEEQYQLVKDGGQGLKDQLLTTKQQIIEQDKKIEKTDIELSKLDQVYEKLQINYLKSAGITDAKARQAVQDGKILETIDKQIASLDKEKDKLNELYPPNQRNTQEYKDAAAEIDNQINKLETTKGKINGLAQDARNFTDELGRDVTKNITTNTILDGKYRSLSDPAYKTLNIRSSGGGYRADYNYASGTDNHPGGEFIAGEEGFELGRMGNRWDMLDLGMYDKPAGYQVFTNDESKKIVGALNNMPGYADGARPSGEANRIISGLDNNERATQPSPIHIDQMIVRDNTDIKKIAYELHNLQTDAMRGGGHV